MALISESWESQDGAAVDFVHGYTGAHSTRPVKVVIVSEDDGEIDLHLSVDDFKSLLKAGLRFDEQLPSGKD